MEFIFDKEMFRKAFRTKGKFSHQIQNSPIKVFPFATNEEAPDAQTIISNYFCNSIGESHRLQISGEAFLNKLVENNGEEPELFIEDDLKPVFRKILKERFFCRDFSLKREEIQTLLLKTESYPVQDKSGKQTLDPGEKAGSYLWQVLGSKKDKDILREKVRRAAKQAEDNYDALQSYFYEILQSLTETKPILATDYYQVLTTFDLPFKEDLLYLLSWNRLDPSKLKTLFDLYYFEYIAQMLVQLNCFLRGDPDGMKKIYFCVSWEKISQTRPCVTEGWSRLDQIRETMFPHAVTLMIINMVQQPEHGEIPIFDYITLNKMIKSGRFQEDQVLKGIKEMTDFYRKCITDSMAMENLRRESEDDSLNSEIKYLFNSVKEQFKDSGRRGIPRKFSKNFVNVANHFLAGRGKLGNVLTINEEVLLFLVNLVIKKDNSMRLNKVFAEFERRGIFFDYRSKEEIEKYFEKLNLIEKKSDSGDAKYVRSIL